MIPAARSAGLAAAFGLAALALGACTAAPPDGPRLVASPGKDKSEAAFRQDDVDCRQVAAQAIAAQAPPEPAEGGPRQRYEQSYGQCMSAKGNTVERRYPYPSLLATGLLPLGGTGPAGVGSGQH